MKKWALVGTGILLCVSCRTERPNFACAVGDVNLDFIITLQTQQRRISRYCASEHCSAHDKTALVLLQVEERMLEDFSDKARKLCFASELGKKPISQLPQPSKSMTVDEFLWENQEEKAALAREPKKTRSFANLLAPDFQDNAGVLALELKTALEDRPSSPSERGKIRGFADLLTPQF